MKDIEVRINERHTGEEGTWTEECTIYRTDANDSIEDTLCAISKALLGVGYNEELVKKYIDVESLLNI